jgi:PHD/YefM family antitoxin component YafN of YafNO toxin-antitoxin module
MFDMTQDIRSLTEFKRHTVGFMKRIKTRHTPMILTVNGKAALVIQDPGSYQKFLAKFDRAEAMASVQEGLRQADRGEGMALDVFEKKMRKKYGISR